ncbi:FAD-dependent oxidoreductase [Limimaricola hongkongensis]|uniref:Xanthan lyase n=1 Tax=Limimaricola hongkongensis DSM 17492 TaxID=1122180 RepID=A0A017HCE1_9RHOB|nr:FAD-dependent oxidoreductase [Limimaricola hongkongensis]EYD71828.1 hypothetical protein Lokhon_01898 [Limimaricola hongkongensis DSM 17492]
MTYAFGVYRATPAGIMAAITAARLGMRSVIIEPSPYIGGMMTSGLNATDTVDKRIITGVAKEFFLRAQQHYGLNYMPVRIESCIAQRIFSAMLDEAGVEILLEQDVVAVKRDDTKVSRAQLTDGRVIEASWWVDASYEGDLMAEAGISYSLGREAQSEYNEEWAGVQAAKKFLPWKGGVKIPPKVDGVLRPYISPPTLSPIGAADGNVQSYCIRATLTPDLTNRVAIKAPEDFDFGQFDLFRQLASNLTKGSIRSAWHKGLGMTLKSGYFNLAEIPNGKFDMNSGPLAPINSPALTRGWVEASKQKRAEMTSEFIRYTTAVLYFIQNDAAVPGAIRSFFSDFGLPRDEYENSGHMPPHVYVREGRRLRGDQVFTQNHVEGGGVSNEEAICQAKYHLDCKPVAWKANRDGSNIVREGMFFSTIPYRYNLPAWIILPKRTEASNFFSVCGVSTSHVAFGSIRMEPTWMEFGSSAAMMAYLADQQQVKVHDIRAVQITDLRKERFDP